MSELRPLAWASEVLAPWPFCDPAETWRQHARRLFVDEPDKMAKLFHDMRASNRWLGPPIAYVGPFLQDGHHRVVTALSLGWHHRLVPVEPVTAYPDLVDYIAELHGLLAGRVPRPAPVSGPADTILGPRRGR